MLQNCNRGAGKWAKIVRKFAKADKRTNLKMDTVSTLK